MPAYAETYLMDAMENLGEMAQAVADSHACSLESFWSLFALSEYARQFEEGSPRVIAGLSGTELALRTAEDAGFRLFDAVPPALALASMPTGTPTGNACKMQELLRFKPTASYWCGWVLAFFQWKSAYSFAFINEHLGMADVMEMYPTFHEESEERFAEAAEEIVCRRSLQRTSRLQRHRVLAGFSQAQLAQNSRVGIRAIQQYEQRAKSINRASGSRLAALARALGCREEDLLEPHGSYEYAVTKLER